MGGCRGSKIIESYAVASYKHCTRILKYAYQRRALTTPRRPKFFRESGEFVRNRETKEFFREIWHTSLGHCRKKLIGILNKICILIVLLKQRLLELLPPLSV